MWDQVVDRFGQRLAGGREYKGGTFTLIKSTLDNLTIYMFLLTIPVNMVKKLEAL